MNIPGLYLPIPQSIKVLIFGKPFEGLLDPGSKEEYVSESLYSEIKDQWPTGSPASIITMMSPADPSGPPIAMVRDIRMSESAFLLGGKAYRLMCNRASNIVVGKVLRGIHNQHPHGHLGYVQTGLEAQGFQNLTSRAFSLRELSAGQKVQMIDKSNRLIAAARSNHRCSPNETVAILAPSEQDFLCRTAHLAAIAISSFISSYVDTGRVCRSTTWVLIIAKKSELERAWTEISGTAQSKSRLPSANLFVHIHTPSLDYAQVLWFMAFLEQGLVMRLLGQGTSMRSGALFTDYGSGDLGLPAELWWQIYDHVPGLDLVMMALVCKKHHRLVARHMRPPFWETKPKRNDRCDVLWLTLIQEYQLALRNRLEEWRKNAEKCSTKLVGR